MLKPLLRVNPSLSGNVKIQCNLSDYINSGVDTYACNIRGAYLNPISSILMNKNIYINMLGSSYLYDLKKYYNSYRDVFYDNCNNINFDIIQLIDKSKECKIRNTDFEMGALRISFLLTGNKFQFLAPIYIDNVNDLPEYFKITISFYRNQFTLNKHIIIPINRYNELNHLRRYLIHYLNNIDNKVFISDDTQKCGFYYGIDLVNGGFVKAKDTVVRNIYEGHNTINNFDAILTYGFKRNNLVMRQILPLCFEFDTENILSETEKKYYKNCDIEITGNYYDIHNNVIDWYDFDMNYDNKTFNILRYNEDAAKLLYIISNNIMSLAYPSLLEKTYYKYKYANKIAPTFNRWKLLESTDENPYIANNSYAFTRLLGTTATYGEFPSSYEMCNALIKFDKLYDSNIIKDTIENKPSIHQYILKKIYDGDLILPSTYTYNTSKMFNKWKSNYINALNRYSFNWYLYYFDDDENIFERVNWANAIDNYVYSSNILYDFNNITDDSGLPIKIDKFANILKINFSNNLDALSAKFVISKNNDADDFFISNNYFKSSNYLFMPYMRAMLSNNDKDKLDNVDDKHDDWGYANIQYNKRCIKYKSYYELVPKKINENGIEEIDYENIDKFDIKLGKYISLNDVNHKQFNYETYFNVYDVIRIYNDLIKNKIFNTAVFNPTNIINAFNKINVANNVVNNKQYNISLKNDKWAYNDKNINDKYHIIDDMAKSYINVSELGGNIINVETSNKSLISSGMPGTFYLCSDGLQIINDKQYSMVVLAPIEVDVTRKYFNINLCYVHDDGSIQLVDTKKIYCVKNSLIDSYDTASDNGGYIYIRALQIIYDELNKLIINLENASFEGYQFLNIGSLNLILNDNIILFDNIRYKINELSKTYNDVVLYDSTYEFLKNALYVDDVLNVNNKNINNSCKLFNGKTFLNRKLLNLNEKNNYYISGNNILLKLNLISHDVYQKMFFAFLDDVNAKFEENNLFKEYNLTLNDIVNSIAEIAQNPENFLGFDSYVVNDIYNLLTNIFSLTSLLNDNQFVKTTIFNTYKYCPMFIYNENDIIRNVFVQTKNYKEDNIIYVDRYNLNIIYNIFNHILQEVDNEYYKKYLNALIDVNYSKDKVTFEELFITYGLLDDILGKYVDDIKGYYVEDSEDGVVKKHRIYDFLVSQETNNKMVKYCKIININHLVILIGLMTSGKYAYNFNTSYYNILLDNLFIREKIINSRVNTGFDDVIKNVSIKTTSKLYNILDRMTYLRLALYDKIKDNEDDQRIIQEFIYTFISKIYYKDNVFYLPVIDNNFNYTGEYIMADLYYKCDVMPLNRYMLDSFLKETNKNYIYDDKTIIFNSDLYVMVQESDTDFYGMYDISTENPDDSSLMPEHGFYVSDEVFCKPLYNSANYQLHENTLLYDYILSKQINYETLYNNAELNENLKDEVINDASYVRFNRFYVNYLYEYDLLDKDYINNLPTYDIIDTPKAYNKIINNQYLTHVYRKNQLYKINYVTYDDKYFNDKEFSANNIQMNLYKKDDVTYLLRYIDVYIDNTSASLKILTLNYITPNSFNTINSHYIDNYLLQYLMPYVKLDFYKIFMQNKFIVLPTKYVIPISFNPYKIPGSKYSYIEFRKNGIGHMISYRWLNHLTPLIYKASVIKDCYNIKYKNTNNTIISDDNSLYKENVHIDIYNKTRIYNKENNGNAYEEYVPIEYKHFNISKFINLLEVIEYQIHKTLNYDDLLKYESNEFTFNVFKLIIYKYLNQKYTDDEIRFLFLKYNVEYVSHSMEMTNDTNMLYTLKYKFILK